MKVRIILFILVVLSYSFGNLYAASGGLFIDWRVGLMAICFPYYFLATQVLFKPIEAYSIIRFSSKGSYYWTFLKKSFYFTVFYVTMLLVLYFSFSFIFGRVLNLPSMMMMFKFYGLTILNLMLQSMLMLLIKLRVNLTAAILAVMLLMVLSVALTNGPIAKFNVSFMLSPYLEIGESAFIRMGISYLLILGILIFLIWKNKRSDIQIG